MGKTCDTYSNPVLWVVDQYAVPSTLPGFVRQFEHAKLLQDEGWKIRVIASPFNHKTHVMDREVSLRMRRLNQVESGVEFSWVYSIPYRGNDWRRYLNMVSFLLLSQVPSRDFEKPSVVLASSPHLLAGLAGWLVAKRFRVPFIFEVRDLWPESLEQLGLTNPLVTRPMAWLEGFLYRQAAAIVALTDGIGGNIRARISNPEKVHVIPNGASLSHTISGVSRMQIRESNGWRDHYVVGWVGAHGAANHLETLIDAAKFAQYKGDKEALFVLIGDGPEKSKLMARASGLNNVRFMNSMPKSQVMEVLQAMDAGVIVHDDTLAVRGARPNKLFDYMAAGLPVLSNLQGETAGIIGSAEAGITVPTKNPEMLAGAVRHAIENRKRFQQLGRNGKAYVSVTHDRRLLAEKLRGVLEQVVSTSHSASGKG